MGHNRAGANRKKRLRRRHKEYLRINNPLFYKKVEKLSISQKIFTNTKRVVRVTQDGHQVLINDTNQPDDGTIHQTEN